MRQKQYPPQTGSYTVKIKSEQTHDHWQDFNAIRLQISVGQEYHEGEKFQATLDWALHRFDHIIICVNDTLQRYNLMFENDLSHDQATVQAHKSGQEWMNRHRLLIENNSKIEIMRWDHWLDGPEYPRTRKQIDALYQNNAEFMRSIHGNIAEIWDRRSEINPAKYTDDHRARFFEVSREYLLEEISVFSMMYEKETAIDVYPGTVIFAATAFQGRHVPGAPAGLGKGHFARIDFARKDTSHVATDQPKTPNPAQHLTTLIPTQ